MGRPYLGRMVATGVTSVAKPVTVRTLERYRRYLDGVMVVGFIVGESLDGVKDGRMDSVADFVS